MALACNNCGALAHSVEFIAPAFDGPDEALPGAYQLLRCKSCGIVFTSGVSEELLDRVYAAEYYGNGQQKFNVLIERLLARGACRRAGRIIDRWQRQPTTVQPSVLDIGCGRGLLLKGFLDAGATVQGLERSLTPVDESMREIVSLVTVDDLIADGQTYDVVIMWHVLEHVLSPQDLLRKLKGMLRPHALMVVAVPNYDSFQRRVFGKHWFHLDIPRHVVHLEVASLENLLSEEGYQVESKSFFEPTQSLFGFIQSAMNFFVPARRNRFYHLLKLPGWPSLRVGLEMLLWGLLAGVLLPFALADTLLGSICGRGATVQIGARFTGVEHD